MTGSAADHEYLTRAWKEFKTAELAFDACPIPAMSVLADLAWAHAVSAACRVDPLAIKSASITAWIEARVKAYEDLMRAANRDRPQSVVDHIDGNPRNNALENLRFLNNQRRAKP